MDWPAVRSCDPGKLILFMGLDFSHCPVQKPFTPGEIQTLGSLGSCRSSFLNQPPEHNPVHGKLSCPLDPLSGGDRGSLNQGFKTVNGDSDGQSEGRRFMQTKWAPDPLSHVEPDNWLQECSHFAASG